jgi:hypothetical protein
MEISYLNHASVTIKEGTVKLLIDPWFEGTCFEGGWGLRYDNPDAIEKVKDCTHLWISHFHQDHFHRPTLLKILQINPAIILLGNNSFNFQLDSAARKFGFKNVLPFYERTSVSLSERFTITRYPTQGIDNMLLVKLPGATILNYNDCVIPSITQKLLKKKFGKIDILLTNFNHAGKLLLYPFPSYDVIRDKLIKNFSDNFKVFDPAYILPFASYHYYRSPFSFQQNDTMLTAADLVDVDKRIMPWQIGDKFIWEKGVGRIENESEVSFHALEQIEYRKHFSKEEILGAAGKFAGVLKKRFGILSNFFPTLYIEVLDIPLTIGFSLSKGGFIPDASILPHIKTHSESVMNWFNKPYGTDSFVVGAHFDIVSENRIPLKWQLALGLLVENKLDLRSLLLMLFRKKGIRFLLNRREEFIGQLFQFKLTASYQKND